MAKVVIELDFILFEGEDRKVLNCDVWDYLEDLIEDESLDYTVYDGDETYGVLDYREKVDTVAQIDIEIAACEQAIIDAYVVRDVDHLKKRIQELSRKRKELIENE